MSKIGVRISINVSKIDKTALYQGKSGQYLDATVFIDPENPSEYGDHGGIQQDLGKQRREAGEKGAYIGNVKVFWKDESEPAPQPAAHSSQDDFDDTDLPF